VHSRLTVYADVSGVFLTSFGHPARSPWNTLALGGIQRYDIDRFIAKLAELRALATELVAYFDTYAGPLMLEAVSDLEDIVAIDRSIDDPPAALITEISKLDLEELARALGERRSLIDIERSLAGRPDLSQAPPPHLARASSLIAAEVPAALLHMRPAKAYAATQTAVERLSATLRIVESSFPILRALSLGGDFPADGIQTVAVAVLVALADTGSASPLDHGASGHRRTGLLDRARRLDPPLGLGTRLAGQTGGARAAPLARSRGAARGGDCITEIGHRRRASGGQRFEACRPHTDRPVGVFRLAGNSRRLA
jgi:hypothetical protein